MYKCSLTKCALKSSLITIITGAKRGEEEVGRRRRVNGSG